MKPGSLVVYIGGQTLNDIQNGYGLSEDVIYTVDKIGWNYFGTQKRDTLSLIERPNEFHERSMFKEIQPPSEVDIEALMKEATSEKTKLKEVQKEKKATILDKLFNR